MLSKVARLATRQVRYLEAGSGRPIVFLHAFPLNADQWLPQLARLPRGWRGVAPDYRGFRDDDSPELGLAGSVTVETYAADIFEWMSHLDIQDAVVVGLSLGGYVAFAMLRMTPARVSGLVLADTRATPDTDEARAGRDRMRQRVFDQGAGAVADEMIPKLLGETSRREQPDLVDVVRHLIEANGPEGIAGALTALRDRPDSTPLLSSIRCPTTIICGDEDVATPPAMAEALHDAIPGSRLTILARAGHLSNLEQPSAFTDALLGSLAASA